MPTELVPHANSIDDLMSELESGVESGLSSDEAAQRLERYGPNRIERDESPSLIAILLRQFRGAVVALLGAAAILSFSFGDILEGVAIVVVLLINALIGFFTELSAVRSMEALHKLAGFSARVRRDGQEQKIDAEDLVPGDVVLVEAGDVVPADIRIAEARNLEADESPLTGESAPVAKSTEAVAEDAAIAERPCMLFKGTSVTRGNGLGVVTATGADTELGTIATMVSEAEDEQTPLEERLNRLGRRLVWAVLIITTFIAGVGILRGRDFVEMLETAIALAVASIPEGLPIVATIALSRGMLRMARRNALVRQLSSVETLGSAGVIMSDKTGTLTENKMTVLRIVTPDGTATRDDDGAWETSEEGGAHETVDVATRVMVLCNNAEIGDPDEDETYIGDPMETALLMAAKERDVDASELREKWPREDEDPFDSESKRMATLHRNPDGGYFVAAKGAPESILETCDASDSESWLDRNEELAKEGFRVLALACKEADAADADMYEGLRFLGLVALIDPPREEVRESIELCHEAGIRVVLVTGDQAATAAYVADAVGIEDASPDAVVLGKELRELDLDAEADAKRVREATIFARVSPEQKLDLVALHQDLGHTVAMTGDGVNDAPALKKADIGVAMGQRGTEVAREVADVVLKDDAFNTIVYAIQEGRVIFGNIRKFVLYLMSCNVAEILVIFLASFANVPLPITPLQILFLNLVTDVFPALALGVGEGRKDVMQDDPRPPEEPILTRRMWGAIGVYGLYISLSTLGAFFFALYGWDLAAERAVTIAFTTLALAQLWHVVNMRGRAASIVSNDVVRNPWVWGAVGLCIALVLAAVYVPGLNAALETVALSPMQWLFVLGCSFAPVVIVWIERAVGKLIGY